MKSERHSYIVKGAGGPAPFTYEIAESRKVSITDGKVFATVKAKLEGASCEFYGITLFSALKPDLEKLNKVFTKQAKLEAASCASVE